MVLIVSTEKFYGRRKADELEIDVQSALTNMGNTLIAMRYSKSPDANMLKDADEKIDVANIFLYKFVRGFDQRKGYPSKR